MSQGVNVCRPCSPMRQRHVMMDVCDAEHVSPGTYDIRTIAAAAAAWNRRNLRSSFNRLVVVAVVVVVGQ